MKRHCKSIAIALVVALVCLGVSNCGDDTTANKESSSSTEDELTLVGEGI